VSRHLTGNRDGWVARDVFQDAKDAQNGSGTLQSFAAFAEVVNLATRWHEMK
jgi:hypothetical protein